MEEKVYLQNKNEYVIGDYRHKIKTFAVITLESTDLTTADNDKRIKNLLNTFSHLHLQYIQLDDFYAEGVPKKTKDDRIPQSYIIINPSIGEAKGICCRYGQSSFFFGKNHWNGLERGDADEQTKCTLWQWKANGNTGDFKKKKTRSNIDSAEEFDSFFSGFTGAGYSVYEKIYAEAYENLKDILDYECFMDAFDERKTLKHRAVRRGYAYNGFLKEGF